jgi:hypothetical protein
MEVTRMTRKAFWKARRGIGALIALAAFGVELSGLIPSGSVIEGADGIAKWLGTLVAIVGAIEAKTPLGLRG